MSCNRLKLAGRALGALGIGTLLYAREVEPRKVEITRLSLDIPRLALEFDGYRIVQISDIHANRWMTTKRLFSVAGSINAEKPDLVAITGDLVSFTTAHRAPDLVKPLRALCAPDGVGAVLGNHDHRAGAEKVRRALESAGVTELANDALTLRRGDAVLHVAGVDDPLEGRARLDEVLEKLSADDGASILLAHEPDFADTAAAAGRFDLQLSSPEITVLTLRSAGEPEG